MKFHTLSIIAGGTGCNASCPFCIAALTPKNGLTPQAPKMNTRNLGKACQLARDCGVSTALITGKGEPTLYPDHIDLILGIIRGHDFPIIELQTNGLLIGDQSHKAIEQLTRWYSYGLTTIAISVVHYDPEKNRAIYTPKREKYIDLPLLIANLHTIGFSVRLFVVMIKDHIDTPPAVLGMVDFAFANKVEQVTLVPVTMPTADQSHWVLDNHVSKENLEDVHNCLDSLGTKLLTLAHGAIVYDVHGQNICLSNCLTIDPSGEEIRSLIYFPDGHVRYAWQYPGAILF